MLSRGCFIVGSYGVSSFLFYRNEMGISLLSLSFLPVKTFLQAFFFYAVFGKKATEYYLIKAQLGCRWFDFVM